MSSTKIVRVMFAPDRIQWHTHTR